MVCQLQYWWESGKLRLLHYLCLEVLKLLSSQYIIIVLPAMLTLFMSASGISAPILAMRSRMNWTSSALLFSEYTFLFIWKLSLSCDKITMSTGWQLGLSLCQKLLGLQPLRSWKKLGGKLWMECVWPGISWRFLRPGLINIQNQLSSWASWVCWHKVPSTNR